MSSTSNVVAFVLALIAALNPVSLAGKHSSSKIIITSRPEPGPPVPFPFPVGIPVPHPFPQAHPIFVPVERPFPVPVAVPLNHFQDGPFLSQQHFNHAGHFDQGHFLPIYHDFGHGLFPGQLEGRPRQFQLLSDEQLTRDNVLAAALQYQQNLAALDHHQAQWPQIGDHQDNQSLRRRSYD